MLLRDRGIQETGFKSTEDALDALAHKQVDTVVADRIVLAYLISHGHANEFRLLPMPFDNYQIAFAMPDQSPLRNDLDIALLEVIHSPEWKERLKFWLGNDAVPEI